MTDRNGELMEKYESLMSLLATANAQSSRRVLEGAVLITLHDQAAWGLRPHCIYPLRRCPTIATAA